MTLTNEQKKEFIDRVVEKATELAKMSVNTPDDIKRLWNEDCDFFEEVFPAEGGFRFEDHVFTIEINIRD